MNRKIGSPEALKTVRDLREVLAQARSADLPSARARGLDHRQIGRHVTRHWWHIIPSLPQVLDGKLNGLCVTTTERSDSAPNLPTMREAAPELANFEVSSWFGIFLPKATPRPVVDELNKQIKAMLERDDIKKNVASMGARADWGTPEQYSAFIEAETKKFAAIIEKEGLEMDVK